MHFGGLYAASNTAMVDCMTKKSSPAGWVVQVTVPAPPAPPSEEGKKWIGRAWPSAPHFRYYNVAVASPESATEAATAFHAKATDDAEVDGTRAVRELSSAEIASLSLSAGEVRPA
jgi:hypothetical protein